jgi:hypothetical protein
MYTHVSRRKRIETFGRKPQRNGTTQKIWGVNWRIILKLNFEKRSARIWTGFIWPRKASTDGLLYHGNTFSIYIKAYNFLIGAEIVSFLQRTL